MFEELRKRTRSRQTLRQEKVIAWMTQGVYTVSAEDSVRKAADIFSRVHVRALPVIHDERFVIGLVTQSCVLKQILAPNGENMSVLEIMDKHVQVIRADATLQDAMEIQRSCLPVVDEKGHLIGILTKSDIQQAIIEHLTHLDEIEHIADALSIVLEVAYEGITLVDSSGIIREFNQSYARFLGVNRASVIGKPVTEVIENTRLHEVIKSGIPERGHIQVIRGQEMVVHRIPIWSNGKVIGAIGMLIFEGVTELYNILGRIQELSHHVSGNQFVTKEKEPNRMPVMFHQIIGHSQIINELKIAARRASRTPVTVLITGESGTGKEVFAKAIHYASAHSSGAFVSINCAAIPEQLLEAELFGYEEGAFTGARKGGKPGKFEQANKGTLFLDEIGDMPLVMQAKILRVLEERSAERIGALKSYHVDARIIAATNRDLESMVRQGLFREDLYYRLNIIRLHVPPLRERKEDIPSLLAFHLERLAKEFGIESKQLKFDAMELLLNYEWPGNIRELVNAVEVLLTMTESNEIGLHDIPFRLQQRMLSQTGNTEVVYEQNNLGTVKQSERRGDLPQMTPGEQGLDIRSRIADHERNVIIDMLTRERGNKTAVARKLGIHRSTLYEKIKKYHI